MTRLVPVLGVLSLLLVACGGDDDGGNDDAGSSLLDGGLPPVGGADASGSAGTGPGGGAGGAGSGGTGAVSGSEGAGTGGAGTGGAGTGGEPTAGAGAGGGGTGGSGLPNDGEQLSICFADTDCNGDDLVCYGESSSGAGFCTEDCIEDSDCSPIAGFEAICSPNGECVFECQDENDTNCPPGLECTDQGGGVFRCAYPEGTGSGSKQIWESCDAARAGGECESGLVCYRPSFPVASEGTGYCALPCNDVSECTEPDDVTAEIECGPQGMGMSRYCRLDCSAQDATCPDGMECENVIDMGGGGGGGGMQIMRCRYPES
jgi:hypothetical protein